MAKLPISWSTIHFFFFWPTLVLLAPATPWSLQPFNSSGSPGSVQHSSKAVLSGEETQSVFVASLHCFYGQIKKADNLHYKILHSSFKDTGKLLGCKHGFNLYYMTCNSSCKFPSLFGSNSSQQCGGEWATWEREDKGAMLGLKAELLQILLKKGEINDFFPLFQDFLTDQIGKIR